jgi:hypothetical protein
LATVIVGMTISLDGFVANQNGNAGCLYPDLAALRAGLGEADAAMDSLELAFQQRSGAIYGIKGSFPFKNLHTHPRCKFLIRRINLA